MKLTFSTFIILSIYLISCNHSTKNSENTNTPQTLFKKNLFDWNSIKNNFPFDDVLEYNFDPYGNPLNDIDSLPIVDTLLFNSLLESNLFYQDWKEYLHIYYFSSLTIEKSEYGIFVAIRDFEGLYYSFDIVKFGNRGNIEKIKNLGNYWETAECYGYTRGRIDKNEKLLRQEILQKCFDESHPNSYALDSIITLRSINDLNFNILSSDTIKK